MNEVELNIDILWVYLSAVLVFLMQAGFLCLESGFTRSKNSINVAVKNLADFCFTTFIFWVVGYGIMFGTSVSGLYGSDRFLPNFTAIDPFTAAFFLFQVMFCGTAITIMSGAVAERMRFGSYMLATFIVSALIYPIIGHWAWGGLDTGDTFGWLNQRGFVDFAGSTVVHSVGGWVSLALLLIIGPRHGRFDEEGNSIRIPPSNLPLAVLGAIFLFVGWLGFNGGSTLALNDQVSYILVNTVVAGSVGAISAAMLGYAVQNQLSVGHLMNGCLGGLVAITANCFAVSTPIAVLIGLIGGMISVGGEKLLEHFKIDDAVGAIPVHLCAGIWGTIALGLYGDLDIIGTGLTRFEQIRVQIMGVLSIGAWSFGISYSLLSLANKIRPLRVSLDHEIVGLNITEHGESYDQEKAEQKITNRLYGDLFDARDDVSSSSSSDSED